MQDDYWFGEWLLNEMEKRNMTRADLHRLTGLNHVTIGYYLTFKRMPTLGSLNLILKVFGKHVEFVDN